MESPLDVPPEINKVSRIIWSTLKSLQQERDLVQYICFFRPFYRPPYHHPRNPLLGSLPLDIVKWIGTFLVDPTLDFMSIHFLVSCASSYFHTESSRRLNTTLWIKRMKSYFDLLPGLQPESSRLQKLKTTHSRLNCLDFDQFQALCTQCTKKNAAKIVKHFGLDSQFISVRTTSAAIAASRIHFWMAQRYPATTYYHIHSPPTSSRSWCNIL